MDLHDDQGQTEVSTSVLVVLVEDHPLHARLLNAALCAEIGACEVEIYADGCSAARRLLDGDRLVPDLLVVDLELPGMDGHELLELCIADGRLSAVPAVVVSSRNDSRDVQRSASLGARHEPKPVDLCAYAGLAGTLAGFLAR